MAWFECVDPRFWVAGFWVWSGVGGDLIGVCLGLDG